MLYSVFDWRSGQYKYFSGPGEERGVRPKPRQIIDSKGRGVPIEAVLPVVPTGSSYMGMGSQARGRVAVLDSDTTAASDLGPGAAAAGLGGAFGAVESNPLATHPWLTLGLWTGVLIVGTRVVYWLGDVAAKRVR